MRERPATSALRLRSPALADGDAPVDNAAGAADPAGNAPGALVSLGDDAGGGGSAENRTGADGSAHQAEGDAAMPDATTIAHNARR